MLKLIVKGEELFDETTNEFSIRGGAVLEFEHSLVSLSKWEQKFQKPFLSSAGKTTEETLGYIEAMLISPGVDPEILNELTVDHLTAINAYIDDTHTATTFGVMPERRGLGETITAELIYYWLVAFNIPFEVETWHLNNLFALVRVCNIKNQKPKKMNRREIAERNQQLNAERRAKFNTKG